MDIEFTLPQKWLDPKNPEHVLLVANRVAAIRFGDNHLRSPVEIHGGDVHIHPSTNNLWLYPPRTPNASESEKCWRFVSRYDTKEELEVIVKALQLWL